MKLRVLLMVVAPLTAFTATEALAQAACNNDTDCFCGDVCSWPAGVCVTATTSTPGHCGNGENVPGDNGCLYVIGGNGQTCDMTTSACTPAWSSTAVCYNLECTLDNGCPCGGVCASYDGGGPTTCVPATSGNPGWCFQDSDCLYAGQTCVNQSCTPVWSATAVCEHCTVDANCGCGEVCGYNLYPNAQCIAAASQNPGFCNADSDCLYSGQTCVSSACSPAWSGASVCTKGATGTSGTTTSATSASASSTSGAASGTSIGTTTSTAGASGTTSSTSGTAAAGASSGTSTSGATSGVAAGTSTGTVSDGGTTSNRGGGCSTAPGALSLVGATLGLGLLRRRERRGNTRGTLG